MAYLVLCALLSASLTGVGEFRYTIYTTPVFLAVLWLLHGAKSPTREQAKLVAPFLLLLSLFAIYMPFGGLAAWKWSFFVAVYTFVFILFNFNQARLNMLVLNAVIGAFFLLSLANADPTDITIASLERGLLDSQLATESTLAFPLGLFTCFWLMRRRYVLAAINVVLTVLAFKRIVFVAIAAFLLTLILPRKVRQSWIFAMAIGISVVGSSFVAIEFSTGRFDREIRETTAQSAGQLSLGRQGLWAKTLQNINFSYERFVFVGSGVGRIQQAGRLRTERWIPFHNDVLLIYLAYGLVALVAFTALLLVNSNPEVRSLNVFLVVLLLSDNVLIYQHVMLVYLLMITQLVTERRQVGLRQSTQV